MIDWFGWCSDRLKESPIVHISAINGEGVFELKQELVNHLSTPSSTQQLTLPPSPSPIATLCDVTLSHKLGKEITFITQFGQVSSLFKKKI